MNYRTFDLNTWARKTHFEHYRQTQCSFSISTEIEISALLQWIRARHYKFYPTFIYLATRLINRTAEFRMALKEDELVVWDQLHPAYTVFHAEHESFSAIWTHYDERLDTFLSTFDKDCAAYKQSTVLFPKSNMPENHFNISSVPWLSFNGFNLNLPHLTDYFQPVITIGKYNATTEKVTLPIAIQIHHAVCDGFHVARFIDRLQALCDVQDQAAI